MKKSLLQEVQDQIVKNNKLLEETNKIVDRAFKYSLIMILVAFISGVIVGKHI